MMRAHQWAPRGAWLPPLLVALVPAAAFAHAVVSPATSAPGAYEKYVLRVPNEAGVATVRVALRFPADVRVVSFADVPGWTLEVASDTAGRITTAVWNGSLPPERFVEFPFIAVNPQAETRLVWPVVQTYADGIEVQWTGPADSNQPASFTIIRSGGTASVPRWVCTAAVAAIALALTAVGVALRSRAAAR